MDCRMPDSSVHGISQTKILEGVVISFSRQSSWPRDQTLISCIGRQFFTTEPQGKIIISEQKAKVLIGNLQGCLGQSLSYLSLDFPQASLLFLELARKAHNWGSLCIQVPCLDWSSWGWLSACLAPSTPSRLCSDVTFPIRFFLTTLFKLPPTSLLCSIFDAKALFIFATWRIISRLWQPLRSQLGKLSQKGSQVELRRLNHMVY